MNIRQLISDLKDIAENTCDPHVEDEIAALIDRIQSEGINED